MRCNGGNAAKHAAGKIVLALLAMALLAGCAAPWNAPSGIAPTPTPQFAGGEPVLPQLQRLYAPAPLPSAASVISPQAPSWLLAGHDIANTFAAPSALLYGKMRWFFQTPGPVVTSPVVGDGVALVNGGDGVLYAVDMGTGGLRWRAPVGDTLVAGTSAIADGVVYVATRGHGLSALRLATGQFLWTVDTRLPVRAAPLVVGSLLFVAAGANDLLCLNRQTGREYWEFKSEDVFADFWPTQGQPAVTLDDGGLVFAAPGASTEFNALRLRTGRKAWELTVDSRTVGAPVYNAQAGLVYVATWAGYLYAIQASTGKLRWRFALPDVGQPGAGFASGPALAANRLFIGDYQGRVTALDARGGSVLWTYRDGSPLLATPVVGLVNGVAAQVYIADQYGNLSALDSQNGSLIWQVYLGELRSAPALTGTALLASSVGDHGLFALD